MSRPADAPPASAAIQPRVTLRPALLAWAVVGTRLTHHNASMQVFADGAEHSRAVWIADLLPHELAGDIAAMIEQGMGVMKQMLER